MSENLEELAQLAAKAWDETTSWDRVVTDVLSNYFNTDTDEDAEETKRRLVREAQRAAEAEEVDRQLREALYEVTVVLGKLNSVAQGRVLRALFALLGASR